jgi:hypothetical protein
MDSYSKVNAKDEWKFRIEKKYTDAMAGIIQAQGHVMMHCVYAVLLLILIPY